MRILGFITLIVLGLGVLAVAGLTVRSIPDIRRYLRIRSM